ncbi:hypothetical protein LCGC14_1169220 [marine sediment metagenome]|uniref:Uncharacterized protein n=1 Tax=marine sediment metagenome TaxID=412755 RepID=A0A0F9LQH4_9ZZZZ
MNEQQTKELRDKIRSKTVGSANIFKSKLINHDGVDIEIKEPSVETWGLILEKARGSDDTTIKFQKYMIWTVVYCCFVPGTDVLIFEDTDYESLSKKPKDSFVSDFHDMAQKLLELDTGTKVKNSEETEESS